VALSFQVVSSRDPVWMMRVGLVSAFLGSLLAWAAHDVMAAGLGIYLGGLGTGFLYPLGVAVALALAPGLQDRGSARLVLASGVAILMAPLVLGLAADAAGVSMAWLLVPALCVAALVVSVPVGRVAPPDQRPTA
jgi:MFS family permease